MKLAYNPLVFEATNTGMLKKLIADVQIGSIGSTNFQTIEPPLLAEPSGGKFKFFANSVLAKNAMLTPALPNLNTAHLSVVSGILANVRLAYRTTPVVYSSVVNVIGGGSSDEATLADFVAKKKFLTHQPLLKVVDETQKDFLYWLHDPANYTTAVSSISVEYDIKFDDGTTESIISGSLSLSNVSVICIPTGYWSVASRANDSRQIESWSIRLLSNTNAVISERRSYVLAPTQDLPATNIVLRNSFGLFDFLRFDGSIAENYEGSSQTAVNGENEIFEFGNEGFKNFKVNTGRLQKGWVSYLKEWILSDETYLIVDNVLKKITKTSKSIAGVDTSKRNDSAVLEFRLAKIDYFS